jgi:hypothetical protein
MVVIWSLLAVVVGGWRVAVSCEGVRFKNEMIIIIALAYIEAPDNCPPNRR